MNIRFVISFFHFIFIHLFMCWHFLFALFLFFLLFLLFFLLFLFISFYFVWYIIFSVIFLFQHYYISYVFVFSYIVNSFLVNRRNYFCWMCWKYFVSFFIIKICLFYNFIIYICHRKFEIIYFNWNWSFFFFVYSYNNYLLHAINFIVIFFFTFLRSLEYIRKFTW